MFKIQLTAFKTIVTKELQRIFRIWVQTIVPPIVTSVLYFIIFGHVIGSRLHSMAGHPYIEYIAPGLIMMSIITNAYSGAVASFFGAKMQRYITELLVAPVADTTILLGYMTGGIARGLLIACIVAIIAILFTHISIYSIGAVILTALLASIIFSLLGIINAIFATKFDEISLIPTFVLTPLIYLGGVFYSIKLLPPFWRDVSSVNPIVYIIDNFRYGFLGIHTSSVLNAFIIMVIISAVLFITALILIKRSGKLRE